MACAAHFFGAPIMVHSPHVRQERVERIESLGQGSLDMIHCVEQSRVRFDETAPDNAHGTRLADPRFIVAVDVAAHGQLRLFLGRIEQLANILGILQRIASAARGAGDGTRFDAPPFDAHETFREMRRSVARRQTCIRNWYGLGLACWIFSNRLDAVPEYGTRNVWRSTTS